MNRQQVFRIFRSGAINHMHDFPGLVQSFGLFTACNRMAIQICPDCNGAGRTLDMPAFGRVDGIRFALVEETLCETCHGGMSIFQTAAN